MEVANSSGNNCSAQLFSLPDSTFGPQYHQLMRVGILAFMAAVSLVGNVVVCCHLLRPRCLYSKAKVLFLNLALSDLLVTVVTVTSQLVWEVMGRRWVAGDAFCRIFKLLQTFSLVSSNYMLVSIALDRHFALVRPLSPCPRPSRLAMAAWLSALLPSLPTIYVFRTVAVGSELTYCVSLFYTGSYPHYHRQCYMAFVFLSVFILPCVLLFILYTHILVVIWRHTVAAKGHRQTTSALPRAKIKTLKMAIVIFGAFVITNLPYVVQEMVLAFGDPRALDQNVVALFGVISASNSAINPFVYLVFHANGRRQFMLLTCCSITGRRSNRALQRTQHSSASLRLASMSSSTRRSNAACTQLTNGAIQFSNETHL